MDKRVQIMRKDLWKVVEMLYNDEKTKSLVIKNGVIPNMFIVEVEKYEK